MIQHAGIVHTVASLKEAAGGVSRTVPGLCEAIAREGRRTILVSQKQNDPQHAAILPDGALVETHLLDGYDWARLRLSFTPKLGKSLESICARVEHCILHDHGLWLHPNHVAASTARRLGIKLVLSPEGMLEPWALRYRGLRKKAAWLVYQRRDLASADVFCASSNSEAAAIRNLGFPQPIAVIPNGIALPPVAKSGDPAIGSRTVLFLSRLHPKKGLPDLIAAWASANLPGWRLVIAGPDEEGHRRAVEAQVRQAGVERSVSFVGPVRGAAKEQLLMSADIFVLPSHSENFGIVVGEALSYGVPVITTNATPWQALNSEQCGWCVEPGSLPLAAALKEATGLTDQQRADMGRRGRALVEARFSWRSVAEKHIALYDWLLTASRPPPWVSI